MAAILDDRVEEIATMKAAGERCMAEAHQRRDDSGFMMWQRCVSQLETMLVRLDRQR
jgi:hypothetical protein